MNAVACLLLGSLVTAPVTHRPLASPPPTIQRPSVDVVQHGTRVMLQIAGRHLERVQRVVFDDASGLTVAVTKRTANVIAVALTVAAKSVLGPRELRVITPSGTSNAVTIRIAALPVVAETEPNNRPTQANDLVVPSLVCGSMHATAEIDQFTFHAKKGQRLCFDVRARRIGSALDAVMIVRDAHGRAIAWSARAPGGDHQLTFEAPSDGTFVLVLRDVRYRGGKNFDYHLRVVAGRGGASVHPLADPDAVPSDRAAVVESEPNDSAATCQKIRSPVAIRGRIGCAGDTDCFELQITKPTKLRIEARSRALGSPLDPLLILRDTAGKRLAIDDDSGTGSDARLDHAFQPGTYFVVVRSLVGRGGPDHTYLLSVGPPTRPTPDFEVRFRPDTPTVRRGSHTKVWCEVVRRGGFTGDVELSFADLPSGVSATPVKLTKSNGWTAVFTLRATTDAAVGAAPMRIAALGELAGKSATRRAIPESASASQRSAWLSVVVGARFVVAPLGPPPEDVRAKWRKERHALEQKLNEPGLNPETEAELARFETAHRDRDYWVGVRAEQLRATSGTTLKLGADGSVSASGKSPATDTYSLTFTTDIPRVTALRLDILPAATISAATTSTGASSTGTTSTGTTSGTVGRAADNGNFVLNRLLIFTADDNKPIELVRPKARFSQKGFDVQKLIDDESSTGWASAPQTGTANWAIFEFRRPIPAGTRLVVELAQDHGRRHTIARFRISVAADRCPAAAIVVPPDIDAVLRTTNDQRSQASVARLETWFRKRSPSYRAVQRSIAEIDAGRGNQAEISRLRRQLRVVTPAIAAAQKKWELETASHLVRWTPLTFKTLRSEQGARFTREPNHVVRVRRAVADKDNYELIAETDVAGITAIRLETIPTADLPKGGAGLAATGNFVLSDISVRAWPAAKPTAIAPVALHSPSASYEQSGYLIRGTLDGSHRSGWGVFPKIATLQFALWRTRAPIVHAGNTVLRLYLEHQTPNKRHHLGQFRISVTNAKNPVLTERGLPLAVTSALATPGGQRTTTHERDLRDWYRGIARQLDGLRTRIQLLEAQQSLYPPKLARGKRSRLAVRITRRPGFTGEVKVALEGFSSGRESNRMPRAFTRNFTTSPVTVSRRQTIAVIEFQARPKCELGTRSVVVRTAAKIGNETLVEYSEPIPFTVIK